MQSQHHGCDLSYPTHGGSSGVGTVFCLSLPRPQLTLIPSGGNVILTWPTDAAGFVLQLTTNLTPPSVWSDSTDASAVVGTQFTVTNANSAAVQFFRLKQP